MKPGPGRPKGSVDGVLRDLRTMVMALGTTHADAIEKAFIKGIEADSRTAVHWVRMILEYNLGAAPKSAFDPNQKPAVQIFFLTTSALGPGGRDPLAERSAAIASSPTSSRRLPLAAGAAAATAPLPDTLEALPD